MSDKLGRGYHNPLIRRMRRHSALTTLFHPSSTPPPANPFVASQQMLVAPDDIPGVVQATLGGIESPTSSIPTGLPIAPPSDEQSARISRVRQDVSTTTDERIPIDTRPLTTTPSPIRAVKSVDTPTAPTTGAPSPSAAFETVATPSASASTADSDTSITDSVWRRLQTIFRRHQNEASTLREVGEHQLDFEVHQSDDYQLITPQKLLNQDVAESPTTPVAGPADSVPTTQTPKTSLLSVAGIQRLPEIESESTPSQWPYESESQPESERESSAPPRSESAEIPTTTDHKVITEPLQPIRGEELPAQHDVPKIQQPQSLSSTHQPIHRQDTITLTPSIPPLSSTSDIMDARTVEGAVLPGQTQRLPSPNGRSGQSPPAVPPMTPQSAIDSVVKQSSPPSPTITIQRMTEKTESQDIASSTQEFSLDKPLGEVPTSDLTDISEEGGPLDNVHLVTEGEQHPVPLQDVWQVERKMPKATGSQFTPPQGTIPQTDDSYGSRTHESISRILDNIAAAGPTKSSIEVVTPRMPRPSLMGSTERIQRVKTPSELSESQAYSQSITNTQERRLPGSDDIVDTAIGPLPADLWTLIDEPIPSTVRRQPRTMESPNEGITQARPSSPVQTDTPGRGELQPSNISHPVSAVPVRDIRDQRTTTNRTLAERIHAAELPSPTPPTPSLIQRVAEQSEGDSGTSVEQQTATSMDEVAASQEVEGSASEENGIDIDDLAQKVYAEVKRKLAVEWERLRTRF